MVFCVFKEDEIGVWEKINTYRAWCGILKKRNDFENPLLRLDDNIKTDLTERGARGSAVG